MAAVTFCKTCFRLKDHWIASWWKLQNLYLVEKSQQIKMATANNTHIFLKIDIRYPVILPKVRSAELALESWTS